MSFEQWFNSRATGYERSEWVKDICASAFKAGQKYEKALAAKRKPKKEPKK